MRIINTFDKIPGCFKNSAFELGHGEHARRAISPELGEKCERDSRNMISIMTCVVNNVLLNRDDYGKRLLCRRDRQAYGAI